MAHYLRRFFLLIDHNLYPIIAVAVVLIALIALNSTEGLSVIDLVILVALIAVFVLVWWLFRMRESKNVLTNATAQLREIKHAHKYALLAFQSEFCVKSMTLGRQVLQLEKTHPKNVTIYRVSVNKQPGKALAAQYEIGTTPAYVLIDPKGNMVKSWSLMLPADNVTSMVNQQPT
jgi:thioredoxin-related protein